MIAGAGFSVPAVKPAGDSLLLVSFDTGGVGLASTPPPVRGGRLQP